MAEKMPPMSPAEYGRELARRLPPPSDEAIEKAARILATVKPGESDGEVSAEPKPVDRDGT